MQLDRRVLKDHPELLALQVLLVHKDLLGLQELQERLVRKGPLVQLVPQDHRDRLE